jgi:hypothetical protein
MWKIKALIQFILSHMPFGVKINHQLQKVRGAFKSDRIIERFYYQADQIKEFNKRKKIAETTVLEIGPGWDAIGCIIFHLIGAKKIHAFDIDKKFDFKIIMLLLNSLKLNIGKCSVYLGVSTSDLLKKIKYLLEAASLKDLLIKLSVNYHVKKNICDIGLESNSIDIAFSYGVLEHIPYNDLTVVFLELYRILNKNSKSYHNIGLHDHFHSAGLGNGVNFLRYSDKFWNFFTGNSLTFHNRLRFPDYLKIFDNTGFNIANINTELTEHNLKILKNIKINNKFKDYTLEELATSHLYVDLIKK